MATVVMLVRGGGPGVRGTFLRFVVGAFLRSGSKSASLRRYKRRRYKTKMVAAIGLRTNMALSHQLVSTMAPPRLSGAKRPSS